MRRYKFTFVVLMVSMSLIFIQGVLVLADSFKICIDPGHQKKGDFKVEEVAPGSPFTKARVSSGTKGVATGKWEYEIVLDTANILKNLLEQENKVILTRKIHDVNISNKERAEIGNKSDLCIRLHCDSIKDSSKRGATILIPAKDSKHTKKIYEDSKKFAIKLETNLKKEGIKVNGIFERSDITGFNFSKVPVIILEMGFMSNYEDDRLLNTKSYQEKLMKCMTKSVNEYKIEKMSNY
ncbi:MAG: N-acetylmuramoyl-L-alanine amidase family protein [Sarcina sp.]